MTNSVVLDSLVLGTALQATFDRRRSLLPTTLSDVVALTPLFTSDPQKQLAWNAFLRKQQLTSDLSLVEVASIIQEFLFPVSSAFRQQFLFSGHWDRLSWSLLPSNHI